MKIFTTFLTLTLFCSLPVTSAVGDKHCVTSEYMKKGLAVRSSPHDDSETVMTIGAGRVLIEFDRKGTWQFVGVERSGGKDGYVPISATSRKDLDGMNCGS